MHLCIYIYIYIDVCVFVLSVDSLIRPYDVNWIAQSSLPYSKLQELKPRTSSSNERTQHNWK